MPHDVLGLPFGVVAVMLIWLWLIINLDENREIDLSRGGVIGNVVAILAIASAVIQILQWFKVI
jgi:hypothetical protein